MDKVRRIRRFELDIEALKTKQLVLNHKLEQVQAQINNKYELIQELKAQGERDESFR